MLINQSLEYKSKIRMIQDKHSEALSPPPVKKERRKSWRDNRNHDNGGPEDGRNFLVLVS